MKKYKHVFFDLDRTLWDFDKNSKETFSDIYNKYNIGSLLHCNFIEFHENYRKHNTELWEAYRNGKIKKEFLSVRRFLLTLNNFGNDNLSLAVKMAEDYIKISPTKNILFPNTIETLEYLKNKYYLYIITNGFAEVQYEKIENSGLKKYFKKAITSEEAGYQKPDKNIFEYSLKKAGAKPDESIMIGDDLNVDILGAKNAGIDQIYFNYDKILHNQDITYEVHSLLDILKILN